MKFSVCSPNIFSSGSHTLLQPSNTGFQYCWPVTLRKGGREGERRRKKFYFRSQDAKVIQKIYVNCHMADYLKSYRGGGWKLIKKKNTYIYINSNKKRKNNGEKVFRVTLTRESVVRF